MALLKRKPRTTMRITEAARLIGCSSESIRTGAIGNFRTFKLKAAPTSPVFCFRAEVEEFLRRRDAVA